MKRRLLVGANADGYRLLRLFMDIAESGETIGRTICYMKIKITLLLLLCAITTAWAQNPNDAATAEEMARKKEINNIKLSESAVYADVFEQATDEAEALAKSQERSKQMLQTHLIEIFVKRMNMSKADVQEIWKTIESKSQNIVLKKGDLFRVFTYVMKDAMGIEYKKPENPRTSKLGETTTAPAQTVEAIDSTSIAKMAEVVTGGQDSINHVSEATKTVATNFQPAVQPAEPETKAEVKDTVAVAKPVVPQPAPEVKVEEKTVIEPASEVVIPALCQNIIATESWKPLTSFLSKEKNKHTLMFGGANKMQFHDKCYIVIVDRSTQKIIAVLDKGQNERMNFITKKMDNYKNYKGGNYSSVFVQEY